MNMFLQKCACHATSQTTRTFRRVSGFAPQNKSIDIQSLAIELIGRDAVKMFPDCPREMGLLSEPRRSAPAHQKLCFDDGSSTKVLRAWRSAGELPGIHG
jgi:hypothetical protein